jgi:hypothetical protein
MTDSLRQYETAIRDEVAMWPGVTVEFGDSAKHRVAVLKFGEQTRKKFYPASPSDFRGSMRAVSDVRRILRDAGATRSEVTKPDHADRKERRRSDDGRTPIRPGEAVQRPDRWSGPLAALRQQMAVQ